MTFTQSELWDFLLEWSDNGLSHGFIAEYPEIEHEGALVAWNLGAGIFKFGYGEISLVVVTGELMVGEVPYKLALFSEGFGPQ